jgi:hypothetical protein
VGRAGWKPTALTLRIPARPDAPGRARRAMAALPIPDGLLEELRFLVGEVVAERVCDDRVAGSEEIDVEVRLARRSVRAELRTSPGSRSRPPARTDPDRRRWQALASVLEALALRWGVSQEDGETVWFELARDVAGEAAERIEDGRARAAALHAGAADAHERAARVHLVLGEARRRRGDSEGARRADALAARERHRAERARFLSRRVEARGGDG